MPSDWIDDPRHLAPARALRVDLGDGAFVLKSPEPLQAYARCTGEWLEHWAMHSPDALAFAERAGARAGNEAAMAAVDPTYGLSGAWRCLNWRETRHLVGRIAQGLLNLELRPQAPIVVLSDNSIDALLLQLAGMHIGLAVCTVSSAYSRLTKDYQKICGILNTLGPALIYASDASVYGAVVRASGLTVPVVFSQGAESFPSALSFATLTQTQEGPGVMAAFAAITGDTHAKYLLTSGSTGHPKVVINTHRMLCANQQMVAQVWRFLEHEKPRLVDWLPWSHTFGGNHNTNLVMRNGGSLIIDEGRPAPGLIEKTVANLAEAQPTIWFNVPRGFDMALPLLEADEALAARVFERLRVVFYAGAALPQSTWERLQALAKRVRGQSVWLTTSWGSTETSPAITSAHWRLERAGVIGGVLPGMEVKFVPNGDKLELRIKGVSVFPGYRDAPALTAQAFDAEGYYCIGDAGYLEDVTRPERGIVFNGRVAEDFKLSTGTWVSVGMLRVRIVSALAPLAQDVVLTGHDRDQIGALIFPSPAAASLSESALSERIEAVLRSLAQDASGSSQRPTRVLVLTEPPNADQGEITDKGYLNQAAVLKRRAADVEALYAGGPGVIICE